jgi:hypothetical protein
LDRGRWAGRVRSDGHSGVPDHLVTGAVHEAAVALHGVREFTLP